MVIESFLLNSGSFPAGFCGLGDLVSLLYALENTGRQKNIAFDIRFRGVADPTSIFSLDYVRVAPRSGGVDLVESIADHTRNNRAASSLHKGYFHESFFICAMLGFMVDRFGYDPVLSSPLKTIRKGDFSGTLVQFDGRCSESQRRDFSFNQKMNIVSKLGEFMCVGGRDTREYLGNDVLYGTGDLKYLADKVSGAELFVGSDSGISHLSGSLGVKSTVYVAGNIPCVVDYYVLSYRNCSVVRFPLML